MSIKFQLLIKFSKGAFVDFVMDWLVFLFSGGVVGFMEGFGSSGLRSLCSNMVTVNEQGKL